MSVETERNGYYPAKGQEGVARKNRYNYQAGAIYTNATASYSNSNGDFVQITDVGDDAKQFVFKLTYVVPFSNFSRSYDQFTILTRNPEDKKAIEEFARVIADYAYDGVITADEDSKILARLSTFKSSFDPYKAYDPSNPYAGPVPSKSGTVVTRDF